MGEKLLNIGFGNKVTLQRVVAIVTPNTAPIKRMKNRAGEEGRLVDATHGRKTRSVIVLDSRHIILSAINAETVAQRFMLLASGGGGDVL